MNEEPLHSAIKLLASACNYASTLDGAGFNSYDAHFGHQLAEQASLSNDQVFKAYKMITKYKGQLARMGVDFDSIPVPVKPVNKNTIDVIDNKYHVKFAFNYDIVYDVKAVPGARWTPDIKTWIVPLSSYEALKPVAEKWGFEWLIDDILLDLSPTRTIVLEGDNLIVSCDINAEINQRLRDFRGRWNYDNMVWVVPMSGTMAHSFKEFAIYYDFEIDESILSELDRLNNELQVSLNASSAQAPKGNFKVDINGTPRPYQLAGAEYLCEKKRVFLADEQGVGKSLTSIMAIKHDNLFPALIICPASVKINWQREFKQWIDVDCHILNGRPSEGKKAIILKYLEEGIPEEPDYISSFLGESDDSNYVMYQKLNGDKALVDNCQVVIVNYDICKDWLEVLQAMNFKAIVCDESSNLKNGTTLRSKAVKKLANNIDYRFLLSGTPMLNRPNELISQLQILDRLQEFGGWKKFTSYFCSAYHDRFGYNSNGAAHTEELGNMLRSICMIRRTKAEVLTELPEKQRSFVYLPLDNRGEYDKAERNIIRWIGEEAQKDEEFRETVSHLPEDEQTQAVMEHARSQQEKARRAKHLVEIEKLKTLSANGKLESVCEWIENFLETGEKLIVFGWHQSIVNTVAKRFNSPSITGATSMNERQKAIDSFQNDDNCKLIALNIKAGGMGITLTAASNCIFLELGWSPGEMDQAESRAHRLGQKNSVTCYYMLGERTIDEDINELLQSKSSVITSIVGGEEMTPDSTGLLSDLVTRLKERA